MINEYIHHEDPRRKRLKYLDQRIMDRLDNDLKLCYPELVRRMDRYMDMLSKENPNSISHDKIMDSVNELIFVIDKTPKYKDSFYKNKSESYLSAYRTKSQKYNIEKDYQDELEIAFIKNEYELIEDTNLGFGIPDILARKNGAIYIVECKLHRVNQSYTSGLGQSLFYRECIPNSVSILAMPDMPPQEILDVFHKYNIQVISRVTDINR